MITNVVCHSGKLGDIVYGLAAVRMLRKSRYLICLSDPLTEVEALQILPLLISQPHIESADIWQKNPSITTWSASALSMGRRDKDESAMILDH